MLGRKWITSAPQLNAQPSPSGEAKHTSLKARSHRPKRKDYEWIAYNSRLLREFYAIAGFERFKTLLRVQIDVFLTRINMFLTKLKPFLRDQYVIRAQIARHAQPRTTPRNHVKLAQKSGIVRDPDVILPFGLCDRALKARSHRPKGLRMDREQIPTFA